MKVKLYIEGGGSDRSLKIKCREGFQKLIKKAGFSGRMPSITACGSRNDAYDDFVTAVKNASSGIYPILLVDSEKTVVQDAWGHLTSHDGWQRPEKIEDEQAQLMVQCMESWCIVDRKALHKFFGHKLQENALLNARDLEEKNKQEVQDALFKATRNCGKDRCYKKGKRSFELLGQLDPAVLKQSLPHFKRLCDTLQDKL